MPPIDIDARIVLALHVIGKAGSRPVLDGWRRDNQPGVDLTSLPGRAPVSSPFSKIGVPEQIVMS